MHKGRENIIRILTYPNTGFNNYLHMSSLISFSAPLPTSDLTPTSAYLTHTSAILTVLKQIIPSLIFKLIKL